MPNGKKLDDILTICSIRIKNTATYPLAISKHMMQTRADLQAFTHVQLRADGFGQLNNREMLGTLAGDPWGDYLWSDCGLSFTCPQHGKSPLDGHMGTLSNI